MAFNVRGKSNLAERSSVVKVVPFSYFLKRLQPGQHLFQQQTNICSTQPGIDMSSSVDSHQPLHNKSLPIQTLHQVPTLRLRARNMEVLCFRNKCFIVVLKVNLESNQTLISESSQTYGFHIMLHHLLSAGQHRFMQAKYIALKDFQLIKHLIFLDQVS